MMPRVRAELLRLLTQGPLWIFAGLMLVAAAWVARWSPDVVDISRSAPPRLTISVAEAVEIAATQLATGLGVMLAALFAAAGPGRDFVDGSAETRQASGTVVQRFGSRVLAVALLVVTCGVVAAVLLIAAGVVIQSRNDFTLRLRVGSFDALRVLAGAAFAMVHATWVVALAQQLRTQAAQLALPGAIVVAMFLVSRLSPYPLTPDSWLGPIVGLRADRAMLDFWWSVGGKVLWPWGNLALLAGAAAIAAASGIQADRRGRFRRLT
jgi:hypothetical protein